MKKLVSDGEKALLHSSVALFLRNNEIIFHQTTPDNKTGNSDVECLHSTLNEHLRILACDNSHELQSIEDKVFYIMSVYKRTIHSTTNLKPIIS